jgi:hypothetical protein
MRTAGCIFALLAALSLAPGAAQAQEGLGLGVIVGEPTGLSLKTWLHPTTAFDLAAAWSFVDEDALHLHGDYLIHNYNTFPVSKGRLPFYYGVGARLKIQDHDSAVGIRVPVGVSYLFAHEPIDLFLEVVPIMDVTPATDLSVNASLGARYYFR